MDKQSPTNADLAPDGRFLKEKHQRDLTVARDAERQRVAIGQMEFDHFVDVLSI